MVLDWLAFTSHHRRMRDYLRDKSAGVPLWGGTWAKDRKGAEMLRIDLDAAGIPYVVDSD